MSFCYFEMPEQHLSINMLFFVKSATSSSIDCPVKPLFTKIRCLESLKGNISTIREVLNYSKQELKTKLEEESESIKFATEAFGSIESATLRDRLAIPIVSIFYDIIDNFK